MKTPNLPALRELHDIMLTINPEDFDQDLFDPTIGGCGCVAHWYCIKKYMPNKWLFDFLEGDFFNLKKDDAFYLFATSETVRKHAEALSYPLPPFTPRGAALRIRHIISLYQPVVDINIEDLSTEEPGNETDVRFLNTKHEQMAVISEYDDLKTALFEATAKYCQQLKPQS